MFAAGFQDNEIGEILGTSDNTGAGGANVWWYEDLMNAVGRPQCHCSSPCRGIQIWPSQCAAAFESVNERAGPLEELGIAPDYRHYMTKRDLLKRNVDLLTHAANILSTKPISFAYGATSGRPGPRFANRCVVESSPS